MFKFAAQISL